MELPEDIVNHICCLAIKLRGVHPFAEEVKTLKLLDDVIQRYTQEYNDEDMEWLIIDLDMFFPTDANNWGVHRKWRSLTPNQRREFCDHIQGGFNR